jgi:hypothetical protein
MLRQGRRATLRPGRRVRSTLAADDGAQRSGENGAPFRQARSATLRPGRRVRFRREQRARTFNSPCIARWYGKRLAQPGVKLTALRTALRGGSSAVTRVEW